MKTVQDIRDLIEANQQCESSERLRDHARHLMEARETGSTTEMGLDQVLGSTPVTKMKHKHVRPGCDCYKFTYEMGGRIGAIPFSEALAMTGCVQVRDGKHGTELYIDGSPEDVEDHDPNEIFVIVGDHVCDDGTITKAVFTWHPGYPLPTIEDGITEDTAVKVDFN